MSGITSEKIKYIHDDLKKGGTKFGNKFILCAKPGCKNGYMRSNITDKGTYCSFCKGYGFYQK